MWKWRGLTLLGRIQIVKSFIILKVLSKAALTAVTEHLIKEINSLMYIELIAVSGRWGIYS